MKYVFGPVSSKRLGQSLGVDLLPMKRCTWNCLYCQLGSSAFHTVKREEFFPKEEILEEIRQALQKPVRFDWITFVGSGETLLYKGLDWLIAGAASLTSVPVAVITNGSLLIEPEVRRELLGAAGVLPSLNAGSEALHERICRPAAGFTFAAHVEGLCAFRKEYSGKLWIEVMLIGGLNDTDAALYDLAATLSLIKPDMVHLVLPTRPAAEPGLLMPSSERTERAIAILSEAAPVIHPLKGNMDLGGAEDLLESVTAIVSRHPVQQTELLDALARRSIRSGEQVDTLLASLLASNRFRVVTYNDDSHWTIADGSGSVPP